jgi:hypothetical protein
MLSLALRTILRLLAGHVQIAYGAMTLRCAGNRALRKFHADE